MMNERIYFIDRGESRILLLDVSDMNPGDDFRRFIEKAKAIIHSQPEKSMLTLFDASDTYFDSETVDILKDFSASNKLYVKASAVVGVKGLKKMMLDTVSRFSGRIFKSCATREEAIAWLIKQ